MLWENLTLGTAVSIGLVLVVTVMLYTERELHYAYTAKNAMLFAKLRYISKVYSVREEDEP